MQCVHSWSAALDGPFGVAPFKNNQPTNVVQRL